MKDKISKYRIVYKMQYAIQLQKMGHKLVMTMPNMKDSRFIVFAFERDATIEEDLESLIRKGKEVSK